MSHILPRSILCQRNKICLNQTLYLKSSSVSRVAMFSMYFRPQTGWEYSIQNEMIINHRTGQQEPVFALESDFLDEAKNYLRKDEL